jgi:membrane fusion protein, multidrug efflux system
MLRMPGKSGMGAMPNRIHYPLVALVLASLCFGSPALAQQLSTRVDVVVAQMSEFSPDLPLTGEIQAQVQTNVAFRTSGKIISRDVDVGQHVTVDQVLARLDPRDQESSITNAEATLSSAQAQLRQTQATFQRQQELMKSGFTTRASFEQAQEAFRLAQAAVDSAEAALGQAREQRAYTDLKAGVNGIIVSRSAEAGQVVEAGQTVFTIAEDGPRDAVFNIHESLLAHPPSRRVGVSLLSDPNVKTFGMVREISPTVNADSGTVKVKIGLERTPPEMTLGASVIGRRSLPPCGRCRSPGARCSDGGRIPPSGWWTSRTRRCRSSWL